MVGMASSLKVMRCKPNMPIDLLIVGQGLAGSLLAWELWLRGLKVMVVDNGSLNASQVAAGLINPVTGQRLVKSHGVDLLLPEAMVLYQQLADRFGQRFFIAKPMLRVLSNAKQRQLAEQRLLDCDYQPYLGGLVESEAGIVSEHGLLRQQQTGYLRTVAMLEHLRAFFSASGSYRQTAFDYAELVLTPVLQWRDLQPRHLVFCEGHQLKYNPWFGQLPLQPAKGEVLHCMSAALCPDAIVNYGFWMIPGEQTGFKTGATFDTDSLDQPPTSQARLRLLQSLAGICPALANCEVIDHQAGIRPTTLDKQPFIGSHPRLRNLHVFNGFGAKGSLAIPYYARQFAEALINQTALPVDCNIGRYHDTHFIG